LIIECKVADYVDIKWGAGALRMPLLGKSFGVLSFVLDENMLKQRKYPLMISSTAGVDEMCKITLPVTLTTAAVPDNKNISKGALSVRKSVSVDDKILTAERVLKLNKVEISAGEYPVFRKTVQSIASSDNDSVIVKRSFDDKKVKFPSAPAILNDSRVTVEFDNKGVMLVDCFRRITVQNYSGVKANSEIILSYIPGISESRFISGRVISPDGKSSVVDPKTIQLMDDDSSTAAPRYPVGKKLVVPFPDVKPGSVIEMHWQKKYTGASALDYTYALWHNMPTIRESVEFKYPAKMQKKIKLKLPAAGFKIEKSAKNGLCSVKIYSGNVPMKPVEPGTPPAYLFAPYAGISMFNAVGYCSEIRKAVESAAANAVESAALAQKLTAHIPDVPGKVKAIRDYVAKNIRNAGLDIDELGVKYITKADVTLREGYGNSLDRAVLLYSMLKAVGIADIDIVLASDMPAVSKVFTRFYELPRNFFDEVVLVVKNGEQELFLNDSNEYAPLEYLRHDGKVGLNTVNGETIIFRSGNGSHDMVRNDWVIKLLPGGSAEFNRMTSYYGGEYAVRNWYFSNITPEKERQYWEQQFGGVLAGAELLEKSRDFKLYPGVLKMRFIVPDFWRKSGDYVSFTLPDSGADSLISTAGKRTLPYCFWAKRVLQNHFTVEIPESWQLCEFDGSNYEFELPGTPGRVEQHTSFEDGLLEVMFFCGFNNGAIYCEPHEYSLLEELQKKLSNPAGRTFLFKTTGK
jgi:hypothetical protein